MENLQNEIKQQHQKEAFSQDLANKKAAEQVSIQNLEKNIQVGGKRVNLRWRNVSSRVLLGGYKRDSLNRMAKRWGIKNPKALSKKGDLTKVMHFLMYAKYGDVTKRNQLNIIAKSIGLNPKQYKKKMDLYNAINKKTSKLSFNLKGGKRRTKKN